MKKVTPDQYITPSKFIKFKVGENRIRVMSEIYLYRKYGLKAAGRYISQIIREGEPINEIFLRSKSAEPKQQWGFVVWDYSLSEFRVLECGPMLGDPISKLLAAIGEYKKHDIIVRRVGLGMKDTKYTVEPAKEDQDFEVKPGMKSEFEYYKSYFEKRGESAN